MKKSSLCLLIGFSLIGFSCLLLLATFFPIIKEEVGYRIKGGSGGRGQVTLAKPDQADDARTLDREFGLYIPKIDALAKVVKDVDPNNSQEYQQALTRGVAHARGSGLPGQPGNVFIFSHSSVDFYLASRYNSVFYLLNKLLPGDEVFLSYQGRVYRYLVSQKKVVEAQETGYLTSPKSGYRLTLMTCWPPGTSLKRLVVEAVLAEPI